MEGSYERVHSMLDYFDGPTLGVADFGGKPHVYSRIDRRGSEDETYILKPVPEGLMPLVLEDWQIWLRWQAAFRAGTTTLETHPALPEDRARHEELWPALEELHRVDLLGAVRARATFHNGGEVEWRRVSP